MVSRRKGTTAVFAATKKNREAIAESLTDSTVAAIARLVVFASSIKGPIPGTPIVVADWQEQGNGGGAWGTRRRPEKDDIDSSCNADAEQGGEDDGRTPSIEKEHVQAVYDTIAPHWSVTTPSFYFRNSRTLFLIKNIHMAIAFAVFRAKSVRAASQSTTE